MKRKLISFAAAALFLSSSFMISCNKDSFTEEDAYNAQTNLELVRDSLKRVGGVIDYSVNVIDASNSSYGLKSGNSLMGMTGAVVTVSQHGLVLTDSSNNYGIVTFKDLRIGTMNVNINKPGYTSVDYVVEIPGLTDSTVLDNYGILRQVSNMVPLFSTTENLSTIKGIATIESNLTNMAPEIAAEVEVKGIIDTEHAMFGMYFDQDVENEELAGLIVQIAYQSVVSQTITDETGAYSLQVPSTPNGLPIKVIVSEFALDQTLLMNTKYEQPVFGLQTVRTIFSSDLNFGLLSPSTIPDVSSAYVVISAPTGTGNAQPSVSATAVAEISESGIASVSINNPGEGYTQAPVVIISKGTGFNAIAATASVTLQNGKITEVEIANAGQGYKPTDIPSISVSDGIEAIATAIPRLTYSITDINVSNNGNGYTSAPAITIQAPTGTGATAQAIMSGYVHQLTLTNGGSGYTQTPQVLINGGNGTGAEATANMSQFNPIHSINIHDFNSLYTNNPIVTISPNGAGSGATATASLFTSGSVASINLNNSGLGYISAPTVTITGGGGFGATAYATLNGDGSINIILLTNGEGYTSDPVVSITAAPAGGTNASATVQRGFKVQSVTINNSGSGYNNKPFLNIGGVNVPNGNYDVLFNHTVTSLSLDNSGDLYTSNPTISFVSTDGNGSGAAATATIRYKVRDIQITAMGSGYSGDVLVTIAPPADGIQATASAVIGNGVLSNITLSNGGQGYIAAPMVKLVQSGGLAPEVTAQITATVSNGRVSGLTVTNSGAGYDPNGSYSVEISTKTLAASLSATVNPNSGQISFIRITNPGAGYTIAPVVEFEIPNGTGSGSGATATAILTDGRISSIEITNAGNGYYSVPLVKLVVPSHNLTALGKVDVSDDGFVNGVSFSGDGLTHGQGYIEIPTVTFFASVPGMGQGATGIAQIENGQVKEIIMTNKGQGYFGKNRPAAAKPFAIIPSNMVSGGIITVAGKTYVRDLDLGTGKRTIED